MQLPIEIRTAGAYVLYKGLFIFQVGPTKEGDRLGVVRLGGHREADETAWDTAKREAFEEAHVEITPFTPNETFYLSEWHEKPDKIKLSARIAPILIKGNEQSSYTIMYLSSTLTRPIPSSESKGLLLLSPEEIQLICQKKLTLNDYLKLKGTAILTSEINKNLTLQPFPQFLFLSRLLVEEKEVMERFINMS